ncbi:MAG: MBL fold metallo-hydrolase [Chloroflexi bacterium]|nr:MBL fold metallo-hydrolase [Chloroflexota bacterium]
MEISWLGHSSIRIVSRDIVLITDPYPDSIGFSMGSQKAHIVTVSNDHPNHGSVDLIGGEPRVLSGPGQYEVHGYNIIGLGTKLEDSEESRRTNTVYTYRSEGLSVCYLGDLNRKLTPAQIGDQGNVDVLIVPAGGGCTINPSEVLEQANVFSPKIIIPIHYSHDVPVEGLEPIDGFLKEFGVESSSPQIRVSVNQTNLPRETQVVVLRKVS